MLVRFLLVILVFHLSHAIAFAVERRVAISNGLIGVELNERGMSAITDLKSGVTLRLLEDGSLISVNGEIFRSTELELRRIEATSNRAVYHYAGSAFGLDVIYEVEPGWHFVSKRIVLKRVPSNRFHVSRIELFRLAFQDEISELLVPGTYTPHLGGTPRLPTREYGAFLRFPGGRGALLVVQNPYLTVHRQGRTVNLSYEPEMDWQRSYGEFVSDRGCFGIYSLSGRHLPRAMVPEWRLPPPESGVDGYDVAEVEAFTACVRAFLIDPPKRPSRVLVGWTLNDYQIDIATPQGREEYKRVIDTAADLGITHLLFAPSDSNLARREDSVDDWKWEYVLWLGLGQKIRRGEWDVRSGPIPPEVQEMIAYARSKGIRLLAYVYPSLPFVGNPEWIVPAGGRNAEAKAATLASREFQDHLVDMLVTFAKRTGIGGYSFDYTFMTYPGSSSYAQWWGWRRVMERLRRALPGIVIDGRQSYHLYGPWSWLAGTYPHPTGNDEQPESFTPFPDLHFDRVSANRQRYVAYWYRNFMFAPTEVLPGYITHQTERSRNVKRTLADGRTIEVAEFVPDAYRRRDWDYLGWKYSLLSSIGTAGWNNVVNMIPGRDAEEYEHFSEEDKRWFRRWLDWTEENKETLRHTRSITGPPMIGRVDGTAAIDKDHGFIFLFNPNYKRTSIALRLDESLGLSERGRYLLRELEPLAGMLVGKPGSGVWDYGDAVELELAGTSARVLEIAPADERSRETLLFGAPGEARFSQGRLVITGVRGEVGSSVELLVRLPEEGSPVREVMVNGEKMRFAQRGRVVAVPVRFRGAAFSRQIELKEVGMDACGVHMVGSFTIPGRVFEQLARRRARWPIRWTREDLETTWLVPERLLLFVQMAEPKDEMVVSLKLDGRPLELKRAYSSVRVHGPSFVGWYADLSQIAPDREHSVELWLPLTLRPGQFQGLFFDNVETEYTDSVETIGD
ncbi:MAG: hypothetical protein IRZ19_06525 [Pyrinomonas methylaliphatogenes]|nr:hypothetical protein [Pyrinomonas methylaliphatogenes]